MKSFWYYGSFVIFAALLAGLIHHGGFTVSMDAPVSAAVVAQEPPPQPAPQPVPNPEPLPAPPSPPKEEDPVASIEVQDSLGQEVVGETKIGEMLILRSDKAIHSKDVAGSLTWIIEPQLQTFMSENGKTVILNTGLKPDVLKVMQIVSTKTGKNAYQRMSIRIGQGPQPPPGPTPPGPTPVDPPVDPPAPKTGNLKVLVVYESEDLGELPSKQIEIFTTTLIREYCDKACSKTAGQADYRQYDDDVSVATEPEWIKKAFSEQRQSLPWIVMSNGTTGFSGPLPGTIDETLALLKKYGGE